MPPQNDVSHGDNTPDNARSQIPKEDIINGRVAAIGQRLETIANLNHSQCGRLAAIELKLETITASGQFQAERFAAIERKLDAITALLMKTGGRRTGSFGSTSSVVEPPQESGPSGNVQGSPAAVLTAASIISSLKSTGLSTAGDVDNKDTAEISEDEDGDEEFITRRKTLASSNELLNPITFSDSFGMLNPRNRLRVSWDICLVLPILVYLMFVLPFRLTFFNEPARFTPAYWWEFLIDIVFILDIILNFRTGYPVTIPGAALGEEQELIEYDRVLVAKNYVRAWLGVDVISGVPFPLIELMLAGDGEEFRSAKALKLLRFLKLARLFKFDKILKSLDRDTLDYIEDFMQNGSTRSAVVMIKLIFIMGFACHIMCCGFVAVGRMGSQAAVPCWFDYESLDNQKNSGPFVAEDTEGGSKVFSIYLASFYFCLTTMISVGYGDIITHNNGERVYVMCIEFVSAIVFATIIANITSVVTSMDTNARKTAEELDTVASFIEMRGVPYRMARRIRRHFRHFYSRKSAIDESKIFSELSTTLRAEVSEFLIRDIMGDDSIFMAMSPTLWPRLLPLLHPMSFETNEVVCKQDDPCTEMYVVFSGRLFASTLVSDEKEDPRERQIVKGGQVNVLHVLGVWHRCVESVVASSASETYAVSELDFYGLFDSREDKKAYERMQRLECRKYTMNIKFPRAPTEFGKPLFISCFSSLELTVVELRRPSASSASVRNHVGSMKRAKSFRSPRWDSKVSILIDLCDSVTNEPFKHNWKHRTNGVIEERIPDGSRVSTWSEDDRNRLRWGDITVEYKSVSVRVRLVSTDPRGKETLLGSTRLPFIELEERIKQARRVELDTEVGASQSNGEKKSGEPISPSKTDVWIDIEMGNAGSRTSLSPRSAGIFGSLPEGASTPASSAVVPTLTSRLKISVLCMRPRDLQMKERGRRLFKKLSVKAINSSLVQKPMQSKSFIGI